MLQNHKIQRTVIYVLYIIMLHNSQATYHTDWGWTEKEENRIFKETPK